MGSSVVARWRDWSGEGIEHLVLTQDADGVVAESVLLATHGDDVFGVRYAVRCDPSWRVRTLSVGMVGEDRRVDLGSDTSGGWTDGAGAAMPQLEGAIDVDLTVSPFTNTLPIRRLGLADGHSAEMVVAYVSFPDLTVTLDPQRYTRLGDRRYRFESLDSDFVRDIDVDDHGLVVTYPGLFKRLL